MLQYDDAQMADFRGYDLVHHDDLNYVASAHAECKFITISMPITIHALLFLCLIIINTCMR